MRRLLRRDGIVDHPAKLAQFAALVTETRPRLEVAGRHPARGGDDRANLTQEQRLADTPGNQEAQERPGHQKDDVAAERGIQLGAGRAPGRSRA